MYKYVHRCICSICLYNIYIYYVYGSGKGELLGLCPSNLYKTKGHLQNISMELIPMECPASTRNRPCGQGEKPSLSGAPSIFKGKYLDSALEGAKLVKKHRQE